MSDRLTSISPSSPAASLVYALVDALLTSIPTRTRAKLVDLLRTVGDKLVSVAASGESSMVQFTNLFGAMNTVALGVAREAMLRGYLIQEEVAPSKTGLRAEMDAAIDSGDQTRIAAAFAKQYTLIGDLIQRNLGSDTEVTRASLAAAVRDISKTGRERNAEIGSLVESLNPVWDRAIDAGFITEDDVQDGVPLFANDREGGLRYIEHMAGVIEGASAPAVVAA